MTDQAIASAGAALARRQATAGKSCARCHHRRPFTAFRRDASRPDGLYPACRRCELHGRG